MRHVHCGFFTLEASTTLEAISLFILSPFYLLLSGSQPLPVMLISFRFEYIQMYHCHTTPYLLSSTSSFSIDSGLLCNYHGVVLPAHVCLART
jgi:hypothetical protein